MSETSEIGTGVPTVDTVSTTGGGWDVAWPELSHGEKIISKIVVTPREGTSKSSDCETRKSKNCNWKGCLIFWCLYAVGVENLEDKVSGPSSSSIWNGVSKILGASTSCHPQCPQNHPKFCGVGNEWKERHTFLAGSNLGLDIEWLLAGAGSFPSTTAGTETKCEKQKLLIDFSERGERAKLAARAFEEAVRVCTATEVGPIDHLDNSMTITS
ncbi:hypothetical protein C8F04DRAFT_1202302 [Mycena alexandri]|uniref:Uncharacterized protein n=1 Tax=Mycena alexandri TaxID=1745969 RepID=A0AAD6S029_9AGAR|nr:hypothetical protein C8F04DRAFT_1202302 [Mycena alexandri]